MQITILFENQDFLAINKPAGLRVHGDGKTQVPTVVDWVLKERPEIAGVGEPMLVDGKVLDRPGIVHRLDEETSGVLVIAKTQIAFEYIKQQFKNRNVQKEYRAFVWGHFKEEKGIINEPIGRSSGDFRRWQAGRGIRGETREAITVWGVIHQFQDKQSERFSYMRLLPKTGRTHQLRVHMKLLQRPIVSDRLYGGKPALGFTRVALHAHRISFTDLQGNEITIEAPFPEDFMGALAEYINS